jgi:ribosome-interacting GTPase 1
VLRELSGLTLPALAVSSESGQGLEQVGPRLFRGLGVIRVYTKAPGRSPDRDRPFTLRRGESVFDLAVRVHRELAGGLKFARVWGPGHFDGQQVGRDHPLGDGDIVELHN